MTSTDKFKDKALWLLEDSPGWLRIIIAATFVVIATLIIGAIVGQLIAVAEFVGTISALIVGAWLVLLLLVWVVVGFE